MNIQDGCKTLIEGKRYFLIDTHPIKWVGNYQIVDTSAIDTEMPRIFDSYEDAVERFNKLEGNNNEL